MKNLNRTEQEPHDRLTRICDYLLDRMYEHQEHQQGDKAILMLEDDEFGGLVFHGYDDDTDAIVAALLHLKAALNAQGKDLAIVPMKAPRGARMINKPASLYDLPAEKFPVTVRALRADSGVCIWEETLKEPGALEVPPLAKIVGVPVDIEVLFGDGSRQFSSHSEVE